MLENRITTFLTSKYLVIVAYTLLLLGVLALLWWEKNVTGERRKKLASWVLLTSERKKQSKYALGVQIVLLIILLGWIGLQFWPSQFPSEENILLGTLPCFELGVILLLYHTLALRLINKGD